jgi:hypothetical protein
VHSERCSANIRTHGQREHGSIITALVGVSCFSKICFAAPVCKLQSGCSTVKFTVNTVMASKRIKARAERQELANEQ